MSYPIVMAVWTFFVCVLVYWLGYVFGHARGYQTGMERNGWVKTDYGWAKYSESKIED
jgi:hypothetical protein